MTREQFIKDATKAITLQYDLYKKFPRYVHFDVTLSTDRDGKEGIKWNIYTPESNHSNYPDIDSFICFMERLIKDEVEEVRKQILRDKIQRAQADKCDAIDVISDSQRELDK